MRKFILVALAAFFTVHAMSQEITGSTTMQANQNTNVVTQPVKQIWMTPMMVTTLRA